MASFFEQQSYRIIFWGCGLNGFFRSGILLEVLHFRHQVWNPEGLIWLAEALDDEAVGSLMESEQFELHVSDWIDFRKQGNVYTITLRNDLEKRSRNDIIESSKPISGLWKYFVASALFLGVFENGLPVVLRNNRCFLRESQIDCSCCSERNSVVVALLTGHTVMIEESIWLTQKKFFKCDL